ncbi:MAG: TatD family hydrolase [Lachnospiraceae bacterium]|jgi:TatD DNase family protein|nr:TatD family hydrolase [Lachnospiraceae bacterium]MEE3461784.1 TatD family hydrolase [Lachnospiraceae bacterium]
MNIFDSHAHYEDDAFANDRAAVIDSLASYGIKLVMDVASNMNTSMECINLAEKYDFMYASVGIHPDSAGEALKDENIARLGDLCALNKVKAVGEIGLDYHYDNSEETKRTQKRAFANQVEMAVRLNMPIIIHSRDAVSDTLDIVKRFYSLNDVDPTDMHSTVNKIPGVVHCFSGSYETAVTYIRMGFMIGVGGVLTFKNARRLTEVVEKIPMDNIVIETDCPYMAPEPNRGKRNFSGYLPDVVKKISEIKGLTEDEVSDRTFINARKLYRI